MLGCFIGHDTLEEAGRGEDLALAMAMELWRMRERRGLGHGYGALEEARQAPSVTGRLGRRNRAEEASFLSSK
jgi:hypothetical protein